MSDNLSPAEALARVLAAVQPTPVEQVPIEAAHGLVLAETFNAPESLPAFDNSSMDGYAVRAADTAGAGPHRPVRLRLAGVARAGSPAAAPVGPGWAAKVMTGAPVPDGADSVVPREYAQEQGDEVLLYREVAPGAFVRRRGEEIAAGEPALPAGALLTPASLGFLAALGAATLPVRRPPPVAILVTGDELVLPGQRRRPGQIIDANRFSLAAAVAGLGRPPAWVGHAPDDAAAVRARLAEALAAASVVVVSGGVSVGDFDHVRAATQAVGIQPVFWGVRQRPGFRLFFGRRQGDEPRALFGLPGNPVSSLVCFYEYVWPYLQACQGWPRPGLPRAWGRLAHPVRKPVGEVHFLRARAQWEGGELQVALSGAQGSHIQRAFAGANCLVVLPAEVAEAPAGSLVELHLLPWFN